MAVHEPVVRRERGLEGKVDRRAGTALLKTKGPTKERTERLFNIRLGEPDPQLFASLDDPQE